MAEHRSVAKLIRFRASELARITKRAQASGRSPACFIREASLGLIESASSGGGDSLLRELARIGGRLEHLASAARAGWDAELAEQVSAALGDFQAVVHRIMLDQGLGPNSVVN